ncbi:hypothetical protein GGD65_007847 [Bradyrhizobium sp. CIR18]|uniref:hypothetical protein n=1 Tax=Bradyrhizobium sp. CIR18 TaxID=2663839 RepID=UPI001606591E|nr:hypothetical protein [Bradyrhizobium sp. CIR18]MBB4366773.1 hypothetical protein [Bradyrhizobium sp. CIR18]
MKTLRGLRSGLDSWSGKTPACLTLSSLGGDAEAPHTSSSYGSDADPWLDAMLA